MIELDGRQHYDRDGLVEYDKIRADFLEALGLEVLRFQNAEIDNDFSGVCLKIQSETERRLKELESPSPVPPAGGRGSFGKGAGTAKP